VKQEKVWKMVWNCSKLFKFI